MGEGGQLERDVIDSDPLSGRVMIKKFKIPLHERQGGLDQSNDEANSLIVVLHRRRHAAVLISGCIFMP